LMACLAALVDDSTAAISVSHAQFGSGELLDLEVLGELATRHGAYLIVDATQSAGVIPLDLVKTPVDLAVGSSHKWLCAPHGAAWCYIGRGLLDIFRPALVGWRGLASATTFGSSAELDAGARRMELGTISYAAGIALGAGV